MCFEELMLISHIRILISYKSLILDCCSTVLFVLRHTCIYNDLIMQVWFHSVNNHKWRNSLNNHRKYWHSNEIFNYWFQQWKYRLFFFQHDTVLGSGFTVCWLRHFSVRSSVSPLYWHGCAGQHWLPQMTVDTNGSGLNLKVTWMDQMFWHAWWPV